jgi:hypothetical protein
MEIEEFIKHMCHDFNAPKLTTEEAGLISRSDLLYHNFISLYNGGYFYSNSLHLYGISPSYPHHDLNQMNALISREFGDLASRLFFFGEDLFGNQFGFASGGIIFFNIESAERKPVASDFQDWLDQLGKELDYYTGESLVLNNSSFQLAWGKRLTPKVPFVLGGDYHKDNLILKDYFENISFNASIARQIHGLPDGTKYKFKMNG